MRWVANMRRSGLVLLALNLLTAATCARQDKGGTATEPVPREGAWMALHDMYVQKAKQGNVDLLFVGDSITQGWNNNNVWQRYYGPRNALNIGIGGDRTQHVLWRLDHGELEGIAPKLVVVMIGTNNVGGNSTADIVEGVKAIVNRLRTRLPKSKILLLGIFPRGQDRTPTQTEAKVDPRPIQVNDQIAQLDDGKTVKYLDIGKSFLNSSGLIPKDLMPDFLHLSDVGYRTWADAIEPTVWEMMESK